MHRIVRLVLLVSVLAAPLAAQGTGTIRGTVRLPSGEAAHGSIVVLRGTTVRTTTVGGTFGLDQVAPGSYVLVATLEGYNPGSAAVNVRAGDTTTVAVTLGTTVDLPELSVTAQRTPNYAVDSTSAVGRIRVPLRDLPQTIGEVSGQVMSDRNILELRRVAENVSSVVPLVGYDGYGLNDQSYLIRGMGSSWVSSGLRDGFKDFARVGPRDVVNIERVEFLKGPNSVLFGATGALGGLPNTVTKRPSAAPIAEAAVVANTFGLVRGTVDLGGPMNGDGTVRYRFNAALERSRTFRPYEDGSYGYSLAPVVEFVPDPATSIIVRGEFTQRTFRSDPALPLDPASFDLPITNYYGEPGTPLGSAHGFAAQVVYEHQFSPSLTFREGLSALGGSMKHYQVTLYGLIAPDSVARGYSSAQESSQDYASQSELIITGRTGSVRHQALVGLELSREVYNLDFTIDDLAPIGFLHPEYGATPVPGSDIQGQIPENQLSMYAQDLLSMGPYFKAMLGARFDANRTGQVVAGVDAGTLSTNHVSPRAGVVYQPNGGLSFYGGWSTSFFPNYPCVDCGEPSSFPPESGVQYEVGARKQYAGGRFTINAAVYQITKGNVLEPIPGDTLGRRFISKQQQSTGAELDVQGSPLPGWSLVLTYAYTNARQTQSADTTVSTNDRLAHVPLQAASLWTTYAPQQGSLRGLTLGGGLFLSAANEATFPNTFLIPAYQRIDLIAAYDWSRWRIQLNLDNLTNEKYYSSDGQFNYGLVPFAPRSLMTSFSARF